MTAGRTVGKGHGYAHWGGGGIGGRWHWRRLGGSVGVLGGRREDGGREGGHCGRRSVRGI